MRYNRSMIETPLPAAPELWAPRLAPDSARLLEQLATLRVENAGDGKTRVRGKAWPAAEPEPAQWPIDRTDPIGNRQGSPGIFADAQFGVYFDNLKVTPNQ